MVPILEVVFLNNKNNKNNNNNKYVCINIEAFVKRHRELKELLAQKSENFFF